MKAKGLNIVINNATSMRKYILVFLIVLCSVAVSADCTTPVDGKSFSGTVLFCEGNYTFEEGIILTGDESVLDCNNAVFSGKNVGIAIIGNKAVLQYCTFNNFKEAVVAQAQNIQLRHLIFNNNTVAIDYTGGSVALKDISADNQIISNSSDELSILDHPKVEPKKVEYAGQNMSVIPAAVISVAKSSKVSGSVVKSTSFEGVFAGISLIHVFALGIVGLAVLSYFASETKRLAKKIFSR